MSAENRPWSVADAPEAEADDTDETAEGRKTSRRGTAIGEVIVRGRNGMGEASRNHDNDAGQSLGELLLGNQSAKEAAKPATPVAEHPAAGSTAEAESPSAEVSQRSEPEILAEQAPAEQAPAAEAAPEITPVTVWSREYPEPLKNQIFEDALLTVAEAPGPGQAPELQPQTPPEALPETAAPEPPEPVEPAPEPESVPTAAELEELTGIPPAPSPALRAHVVRPAGFRRPQPAHAPTPAVSPVALGTPASPNVPSGYNPNAGTPNVPSTPNVPPAGPGGNGNMPPGPPFGGGPGGPVSPGNNPNQGGNWNPAQNWRQTAYNVAPNLTGNALPPISPVPPVEAAPNTAGALLGGILIGRYLFSGRRKLKRQMRRGFQERDRKLARVEADQRFAQAEQATRQTQAAREQARLNRELTATRQRLGSVEQQHQELETQHVNLADQVEADRRKSLEKRREAEKAEKSIKARAAQQLKGTKARFERFRKTSEQPERSAAGAEGQLVAREGNRFERSGWVTNEVDAQGRVVSEAESVLKHGQAFHQERAVERGVGVKGQSVGEMALLGGSTAAGRQAGGGAGGGDGGASYVPAAGQSAGLPQPGIPGAQQAQLPASARSAFDAATNQKPAAGPIWPYLLTLAVILICLLVLLR